MRHEVIFTLRIGGPVYRVYFKTDEEANAFLTAMTSADGGPPQDKTLRPGPGQKGY